MNPNHNKKLASEKGIENKSYIESKRNEKTKEILNNIFTEGLYGNAAKPRLRSYDQKPCETLSVNIVNVPPPSSHQEFSFFGGNDPEFNKMLSDMNHPLKQVCRILVSSETEGAWHIATERENDPVLLNFFEYEERLRSSILFVLKAPKSGNTYTTQDEIGEYDNFSKGTFPFSRTGVRELKTKQKFTEAEMLAIFVPKSLESVVRSIFKNVTIISVNVCLNSISVKRNNLFLEAPDYETALHEYLQKNKLDRFTCHVTRLPTRKDMLIYYPNELNIDACMKNYEMPNSPLNPELTMRQIAAGYGYCEDLEFLFQYTTLKVNAAGTDSKKTALHNVLTMGNKDHSVRLPFIQFLLSQKADKTLKDAKGNNCDFYAKMECIDLDNPDKNFYIIQKSREKEIQNQFFKNFKY